MIYNSDFGVKCFYNIICVPFLIGLDLHKSLNTPRDLVNNGRPIKPNSLKPAVDWNLL
jgi:hypothetical protein